MNQRRKNLKLTLTVICMLIAFVTLLSYISMVANIIYKTEPKNLNTAHGNRSVEGESQKNIIETIKVEVSDSNVHKNSVHVVPRQFNGIDEVRLETITTEIEKKYLRKEILKLSEKQPPVSPPLAPSLPILLSLGRPASSDVRGNLGPPDVVTNENIVNWLEDRWQAAKDMTGKPIPGQHWLEIDLQRLCKITHILIDWETAYSNDYTIIGRSYKNSIDDTGTPVLKEYWVELGKGKYAKTLGTDKKHIIHDIVVHKHGLIYPMKGTSESLDLITIPALRFVRLIIHKPSTEWGSSVWRFHIYGTELGQ